MTPARAPSPLPEANEGLRSADYRPGAPSVAGAVRRLPMKDFLRHGALVFAGLIVANVLTYVYYALVSRALGVEAAGLFTALISAVLVSALPANVVASVVAKIAADARARGQEGALVGLAAAGALLLFPLALVALVGATLGEGFFGGYFHASDRVVIALAAAGFALTFVLVPQRAVLQGSGKFAGYALSSVVEGVGKAATGIVCFVTGAGLRAALGGYVLATAAAFLANLRLTRIPGVAAARPGLPGTVVTRHLIGIALPISALTAVTFADAVLVRHYLDARASGLYGATALVGRALLTVIQFVPVVLMPKAAIEHAAGRSPARLLVAASAVTAGAIAVTLLAASTIPGLLVTVVSGPAFAGAAPLVLPYAVAMGALAGATVLASYLIGIDRTAFAVPLAVVACAEVAAIVAFHPNLGTVVRIVVAGHCAALACCLVDVIASLRGPQGLAGVVAEVTRS